MSQKSNWQRIESKSNPGNFYYFDNVTGKNSMEQPPDFKPDAGQKREQVVPVDASKIAEWKRVASKTVAGEFYFYNSKTGESSVDPPAGVPASALDTKPPDTKSSTKESAGDLGVVWKRIESQSIPGQYFYHNETLDLLESQPPEVKKPWKLRMSTSQTDQFYYHNEKTQETTEHPPPSARAVGQNKRPRDSEGDAGDDVIVLDPLDHDTSVLLIAKRRAIQEEDFAEALRIKKKIDALADKQDEEDDPDVIWQRVESKSTPGSYYYHAPATSTSEVQPPEVVPPWYLRESRTHKGQVYYFNEKTQQSTVDPPPCARAVQKQGSVPELPR